MAARVLAADESTLLLVTEQGAFVCRTVGCMLYGVDVHDGYQAGISFPLLARQGYSFATVKLTQGTDYVRTGAAAFVAGVRSAGMIPGAYHWLNAAEGGAQARWFFRYVQELGGPDGLLIQLDCEDNGYGPQIAAWAAEWNRLSGSHPFIIYSGSWWWPKTGGYAAANLTPYLWHSHYLTADTDSVPDDPAAYAARIPAAWWVPGYGGWTKATILQFTSQGDAGGLANNVDLNVTTLTRPQLLDLARAPQASEVDMTLFFWANDVPDGWDKGLYAWTAGSLPQHITSSGAGDAIKAEYTKVTRLPWVDNFLSRDGFNGLLQVRPQPVAAPVDPVALSNNIIKALVAQLSRPPAP